VIQYQLLHIATALAEVPYIKGNQYLLILVKALPPLKNGAYPSEATFKFSACWVGSRPYPQIFCGYFKKERLVTVAIKNYFV
jgi:hypothetical protein